MSWSNERRALDLRAERDEIERRQYRDYQRIREITHELEEMGQWALFAQQPAIVEWVGDEGA